MINLIDLLETQQLPAESVTPAAYRVLGGPLASVLACAAGTLLICYLFGERQRSDSEPPLVPGSRLFGNGPQFQANAVQFLLDARRKFGSLFTIRFPGHHIHMLMNPHSIGEFSRARSLDFAPIHKQVTTNVFSFEMPDSHRMLRDASKAARAALKDDVFRYQAFVDEGFDSKLAGLAEGQWRTEMLDDFLADTQFRAIFNSIFGRSDEHQFNHRSARGLFADIHASFNYVWLGFPVWMFPKTKKAWQTVHSAHPAPQELLDRDDCSVYIKSVMSTMMEKEQPVASMVGHNMVYLHVNYNTKKATYWAINNLLKDRQAYAALQSEIDDAINAKVGDSSEVAEFSSDEIDRLPLLDSFIKETFRLSSGVFMIRAVTEDTVLEVDGRSYLLRKGDKAAVYPPALHRDPEMYDSPNDFRHDRFIDNEVTYEGKRVSKPILPYGVLCPAAVLIQFKWFMFAMLARFQFRADEGGQTAEYDFNSYGHEILPPVSDIPFNYAARDL
uniref:Cytochrome P450 n=3 Tax=Macrostomum lignano TaxID=282301 RepID=A0A1I8ITJ4_9PLAT